MATDIFKYSRVYDWGRYYFDLCTRTQFSRVIIRGRENIPSDGLIIYAPNHVAAMMDPLVTLLVNGHGPVGFGARSDIFANPIAAWALHFVRILPLARERNGLKEVAKNYETFDDIVNCLRHGMPFCMYAEGTHRPERGLLPLKKGVFRIAKMANEQLGKPVYVVPISSDYEYFYKPMGRIALTVGEPINVGEYFEEHKDQPEASIYKGLVDTLTTRIKENLEVLPQRKKCNKALGVLGSVLSLPVWLVCAILSIPIWLPSKLIIHFMEDKAFSHTVYFAIRLFFPYLWPFYSLMAYLENRYCDLFRV
ncbi:MAG: 1-acyl-sn-glycerol-3-phosphate acyltransferase [Bacteroidales bacterium]|nr:1-acyl-sn-glycerol-3-phosphate acyltransferase [Bacteroidales bacterium]